jgi:hypothetical protein
VTEISDPALALTAPSGPGPAEPPPVAFSVVPSAGLEVAVRLVPAPGGALWGLEVRLAPGATTAGVSVGVGDETRPTSGWHGVTVDRGTAFEIAPADLATRWIHFEWLTPAGTFQTEKDRLPFTGGPT